MLNIINSKISEKNALFHFFFSGATPVIAARNAAGLKFKMNEEFTIDSFSSFLTDLEAGELEPYLKSGNYYSVTTA